MKSRSITHFDGLDPVEYVGPGMHEKLDREACALNLEYMLHPGGVRCPGCGSVVKRGDGRDRGLQRWSCGDCRKKYTILSSTVWSGSKLGPRRILLCKWLLGLEIDLKLVAEILEVRPDTIKSIVRKLDLYNSIEVLV